MSSCPDKKIIEFLHEHHVVTLSTVQNNAPWCAHCFYTFDEKNACFYVASDMHTRHAQEALQNSSVAGGVVLETKTVGKIRGLQFTGTMVLPEGEDAAYAKKKYLLAFPFAVVKKNTIWKIQIEYAKYTDNRLGFGTKIIWE